MVSRSKLGEEVIAPDAALGEYPPNLSAAEGAVIWMQYVTAYGALISITHLEKGDFVLIPAASSSVGIAAIGCESCDCHGGGRYRGARKGDYC